MNALAREVQNVQNPALGAALVWRFCCGYVAGHRASAPPPLALVFLVLPIVLHQATSEFVRRTYKSSGLRAFAAKFGDAAVSKQDLLLQIHDRTIRWRGLSLQSVELAAAGRLISLEESGEVLPLSRAKARGMADEVKQLMDLAEKLGFWCGELTVHEVVTTLRVKL
ncbi:three component ABC system middle component [Pseudoxanthomonas sp. GM95]|uniref:three component ABC system middle component n=1 Tax=Pseudoxanthomonas sp. GM95 TaxID=1881043 RepID=UPI000B88DA5E|nr:three component ABC system middle component [Pseudoxanthomonas sp. GM95]